LTEWRFHGCLLHAFAAGSVISLFFLPTGHLPGASAYRDLERSRTINEFTGQVFLGVPAHYELQRGLIFKSQTLTGLKLLSHRYMHMCIFNSWQDAGYAGRIAGQVYGDGGLLFTDIFQQYIFQEKTRINYIFAK
jgi:hypothetical protein